MSRRRASLLAWSLFALFVLLSAAAAILGASGRGGDAYLTVVALGFPLVGAIIASRRPGNAVGWLLLAIGVLMALGGMLDTNVRSASAPALGLSAWLSEWIWYVWLTCAACVLPQIFPTGRLVSPRWRPVLWLSVAALITSVTAAAFTPGPFGDVESPRPIENPFGIPGAGGLLEVVGTAGDLLAIAAFLGAGASLVVRFRRSRGTERQQLKWFAFAGMLTLTGLALAMLGILFGAQQHGSSGTLAQAAGNVGWFITLAGILFAIPLATGMAILRHRLYDIDVVINRTLVYGALTAILIGAYLGMVLLFQLALTPLTEQSDLAIAGSTLAVAALFRPARGRVQELVDRRFYRSKYDAAHEVEAFSARLRDEVELDALSRELGAVARHTMQPAHVSLWLRAAP